MKPTILLLALVLLSGCDKNKTHSHASGQVTYVTEPGFCTLEFAGGWNRRVYCACPDTIEVGDRFTLEFKNP